jgi:queuosine precursor transporter
MIELLPIFKSFPNEAIGLLMYLAALGSLYFLHHFFSKEGIFTFIILSTIVANIQTLKAIDIIGFQSPIAMGTILFTTSFLATDILVEFYGREQAQKAIWLGFSATLILNIFMLLTLCTRPSIFGTEQYYQAHNAMETLFSPALAIFSASLIAYLVSQYTDVVLFSWMKRLTQARFLGLRISAATLVSTLLDHILFSVLAWKVFYPLPLTLSTFFTTYILGASLLRIILTGAHAPFIYLLRFQNKKMPSYAAYVS